jgi:hypothetical protein
MPSSARQRYGASSTPSSLEHPRGERHTNTVLNAVREGSATGGSGLLHGEVTSDPREFHEDVIRVARILRLVLCSDAREKRRLRVGACMYISVLGVIAGQRYSGANKSVMQVPSARNQSFPHATKLRSAELSARPHGRHRLAGRSSTMSRRPSGSCP